MTAATILLTGANGRTGRAVLRALVARGLPVRAFIRNAAQSASLIELGAKECVVGNMGEPGSVRAALEGCATLIHIGPPMHPDEKTMTGNFLAAGREVGLRHFIYYSVMHPLRTEVRHHRLKLETEEQIVESDLPFTILQPMRYMQHLEPIWKAVNETGVHAMPFSTSVKFNVVDLLDLADATANVAAEPQRYSYGTYELAGPEGLSQNDMAAILSRVLGRTVTARAISLDELEAKARAAGASDDRVQQMRAMNAHYDQHGFRGNPTVLRMLLGREPGSYEAYVRRLRG